MRCMGNCENCNCKGECALGIFEIEEEENDDR